MMQLELVLQSMVDRRLSLIVIWDLENKKAIFSLATLGGFAYSLGFSPLERAGLAIGGGDNSLRAWNLTSSTKSCSTYWQGIKGKVTTEESSLSTSLDLYSCGDGHIYIHSTSNLQREAHNFDHLVKKYVDHQNRPLQRTELAWKQDFTALAVGNEDGSIEVYSTYMVLLARLEGPKKLIQCLSWHPRYTGTSDQVSPLHGWLACASNENTIYVYDLARIIKEQGTTPVVVTEATRELIGHHFRVVALAWSPHCDARLASASYDATVQNAMAASNMRITVRPGHLKSKPWFDKECYLAKKLTKESLTIFRETNTMSDRNVYISNRKK
ncbi:GEMIN5 [Cordylochernes scorpioides]|uniref:GEMIN5 n=1 Tax=Cordylochernes scorpioides TaxID=51811 RepID=A0ABY6LKC1_9ARAC|nr:GEMIN5 [Cordylochernes scorpioides]